MTIRISALQASPKKTFEERKNQIYEALKYADRK